MKTSAEFRSPLPAGLGSVRFYSDHVTRMPEIKDLKLQHAFKDLMAENWDELPHSVIHDVKSALSGNTDDKAGKEIVENVFRAAEAIEEFSGILVTLKMEIDDSIGLSGEVSKCSFPAILPIIALILPFPMVIVRNCNYFRMQSLRLII